MPALNLTDFAALMAKGDDFEVTQAQYEAYVKKSMPSTRYLQTGSPLKELAREQGYALKVEDRIHRVLIFSKKEKKTK